MSLLVDVYYGATESYVSEFRIDITALLQDNTSLESLTIRESEKGVNAEEVIAIVTALQINTTLKTLQLYDCGRLQLTGYEDKQMASLFKKNYALEVYQIFVRIMMWARFCD
jgi:hypothetical protein